MSGKSTKRNLNSDEKELPYEKKQCQENDEFSELESDVFSDCEEKMERRKEDTGMTSYAPQPAAVMGDREESFQQLVLSKLNKLDTIEQSLSRLSNIEEDVKQLRSSFETNRIETEDLREQLSDACEAIDELKCKSSTVDKLESEVQMLKERNKQLEEKVLRQENYSRRENVIIHGMPVNEEEDCYDLMKGIFARINVGPLVLSRCHRLHYGKRPIIARFLNYQDKVTVMKNRRLLKGSNIFINDDVAPETSAQQDELLPVMKYLRQKKVKANMVNGKVKYNGKLYGKTDIVSMPITLSEVGVNLTNKAVAFAGQFSPLSNLYPCTITIKDTQYSSSEQFYQQQKCLCLNQPDTAQLAMLATTPREAMSIGKAIKPSSEWVHDTGMDIMNTVIKAKLQQVDQFRNTINLNKGKQFIEFTRHNLWGIGHPFSYTDIPESKHWKGENLMGNLLTELANST